MRISICIFATFIGISTVSSDASDASDASTIQSEYDAFYGEFMQKVSIAVDIVIVKIQNEVQIYNNVLNQYKIQYEAQLAGLGRIGKSIAQTFLKEIKAAVEHINEVISTNALKNLIYHGPADFIQKVNRTVATLISEATYKTNATDCWNLNKGEIIYFFNIFSTYLNSSITNYLAAANKSVTSIKYAKNLCKKNYQTHVG